MKKLTLPVEFGGLSIGENTVRLGVHISRGDINLDAADAYFTNHRLALSLLAIPSEVDKNQKQLDGMDTAIVGSADVKGLNVTSETIGIGLTFSRADVDVQSLSTVVKRGGKITITASEAITEDEPEADESEEEPAPKPKRGRNPKADAAVVTGPTLMD